MPTSDVRIVDIPGGIDIANDTIQLGGNTFVIQRIKIGFGDDGVYLDVAGDSPLPVVSPSDDARALMYPKEDLIYARDASDRMRVSVDTGSITVNGLTWGNNNSQPTFYSTGGANSMDAREIERTQTRLRFMQQRARWALT